MRSRASARRPTIGRFRSSRARGARSSRRSTGALVTSILERWPHPEQGYRACLGLLSLRKRYTDARLEAACARALKTGVASYKSVKSILAAGLDQLVPDEPPPLRLPATHAHI